MSEKNSDKKDSKQEVIARAYQQAACGLHGGVGNSTNGSCGALSGAVMAISYLYGRPRKEFEENISNKRATDLAKKVYDRFVDEYGGCLCKKVQTKIFGRSFDFWNEEEVKAFEEAGGHKDKCPGVVAKAATWAAEILWDEIHAKK